MKKYLFLILALLAAFSARALPFVPTLDPSSLSTRWYKLRVADHYIYAKDNFYFRALAASASDSSDDAYLWCFVGSASTGYKVYNKAFKEYITANTLGNASGEWGACYEPSEENVNDFHIYFLSGEFYQKFYVVFNKELGTISVSSEKGDPYNAIAVDQDGNPIIPTRYDENGVGYAFVQGARAANQHEIAMNLCDGSTDTKFVSHLFNFYVVVQADRPVAVTQYSLVTANDSRSQYTRLPRSWILQGSNNKINWTDLDVKINYPMPLADRKEEIFELNSTQQFTYFKLRMTDWVPGSESTQLSEFWINRQKHQWGTPSVFIEPTCGSHGTSKVACSDCGVFYYSDVNPSGTHNYQDGNCTVCGRKEGETVILYNGQAAPYYADAMHGYRNSDETWPSPPEGWNQVDFNGTQFTSTIMPIASPGHTGGPFQSMIYNALWYDEYNCFWFRRPFTLPEVDANATYTLRYIHDDNVVIYINGQEVLNKEGWTAGAPQPTWANSYESVNISPTVLQQGKNVLAVYIQQNWGGAYFDCELVQQKGGSVPGDVTGDGKVDIDDINALINILTGKARSTDFPGNVDVSGDNKVDVEDINLLINMILGV